MLKSSFLSSLCLFTFLFASCQTSAPKPAIPIIQLDERLEKIKMTDLKGKPFSLHQLAGKPVFLNFWATWCRPCVSEMQSIEEVSRQFKDEIVFLSVSPEDIAKIKAFQQDQKFSFDLAQLNIDFIDAYVIALPTTLLINRKGELVAEEEGLRIWTQPNNLEKLKALAKGP